MSEETIGNKKRRCTATNRRGEPCGATPLRDQDLCNLHAGQVDYPDFTKPEVRAQHTKRRDVRGRLAEDAAEEYEEKIKGTIDGVLNAETTRSALCVCGRRVSVTFDDLNARLKAVQLWLEQGYGKPKETTTPDPEGDLDLASMSREQRADLRRRLLAEHPHLARLDAPGANGRQSDGAAPGAAARRRAERGLGSVRGFSGP